MIENHNLDRLLAEERARHAALVAAEDSIAKAIAIAAARIEHLQDLVLLQKQDAELQGPIAGALQMIAPTSTKSEESADDGNISRTLGRRIYGWLTEYFRTSSVQSAAIKELYRQIPPDMRAEIEAVQSANSPEFRFRRLLRKNKDDFSVDRTTGIVTYLKHQDTSSAAKPAGVPSDKTEEPGAYTIVAKRVDSEKGIYFQYITSKSKKVREAPIATFVSHINTHPNDTVSVKDAAGKTFPVAVYKSNDGQDKLASYSDGKWNSVLDDGVAIVTAPPPD